jgi:hypothetical protein
MSKKMMLLAIAAVSAAMFALPAVASAGTPEVDFPGEGKFTLHGPAGALAAQNEPTISCTTTEGSGQFTSKTTGTVSLIFNTCSINVLGVPVHCESVVAGIGAGTGIIKTTNIFHTTYVTPGKTSPGVQITPTFPTLLCGSARLKIEGNGILGEITAPKCGEKSKAFTLNFKTNVGPPQTQVHTQITGTGTVFVLKAQTEDKEGKNIGSAVTGALKGEATGTWAAGGEGTLTCV